MAYVYGGSDTTNQSWGTGKTRCRVQGVLSSTDTNTTVTIDGAVQSVSPNTMAYYGVRVTIGHKGGGGVSAGSTHKDGVLDYTAWVASVKKAWSFPRKSSAYKVTIYCSYEGRTVDGYGAAPVKGTVSTKVTIPALPVYKPSAVTAASATRNSDTQVTVKWTNHAATTAPYSGVYVYRQADGGSWVKIATASGSATSYVDKGTTANHYYAYRMQPYNSAGSASSYGTTGTVYMTPSAPANFTAKLQQGSDILLSWTTDAVTASSIEIEGRSKTDDSWGEWTGIVSLAAGTTSYTRTGAPGGTVQYRIRTVRTSPGLQSAWVESNETVTIQPPAAPTLTNLPSANIAEGTESVVLSWRHNSLDTSDQTKAEIVVTGAISQTYTVTGSDSTYSLDTASLVDGQSVTYKVRTWGADEEASPYSTTYTFTFRSVPYVTIINPPDDGYVLEQLPLNVQWAFSNGPYDLVSWQADLLDRSTGSSVYSVRGTSVNDIVISKNTYMPSNGGSYELQIRVIASTGLSATESRGFVVDYDEPAPPIIDGEFDQSSLKTILSIRARNIEGMPTTESLQLYRVMTEDASDVRYANLVSGLEDPVNGVLTVYGGYADIYNYVVAGKNYYVGFDYADGGADYWSAFVVDQETGDVKADQIYHYPTDANYGILRVDESSTDSSSGSKMAIRIYNGAPGETSVEPMVLTGLRVYEVETYPEYDSRTLGLTESGVLPSESSNLQMPNVPVVSGAEYSLPVDNLSGTNLELLTTNEVSDVTSVNDSVPQLNSYVLYKLSAISNIGTVSNSYVKVFTDSRRKYAVNWGDDLSDVVIFEPGVTYKESPKRTTNTYHPSGRKYGVSFDGENFDEGISFSADLIDINTAEDSERDYRLVREMIASDTNKVMRIPNGSVFYISTPSPEFSYDGNNWYRTMSFDTEVVDGSSPTVINWRR